MRRALPVLLVVMLVPRAAVAQDGCCVLTPLGNNGVRVDRAPIPVNRSEVADSLDTMLPTRANARGATRPAQVWLRVGTDGVVKEARLAASSGDEAVDSAFLRAARALRFDPAVADEKPVEVWIRVPFTMQVREDGIGG